MITDPEWMTTIEENLEVRFVDMDVYKALQREIKHGATVAVVGKDGNNEYQKSVQDLEAKKKQLEAAKKYYDELLSKLGVSLGNWCGGCKGGFGYCQGRVQYLMEKYGTTENKAKVLLMMDGKCILPG